MKGFDSYTEEERADQLAALSNLLDASTANNVKKIQIKHGYVTNLGLYEIVAFISRVTQNDGKHSWQRIFESFDEEDYKNQVARLFSSGCYEEIKP